MHDRSDWAATPPKKTRPFKAVNGIVIHFAGFNISPKRDTPGLLRSIQQVHTGKPRNWWDIAYNILVDQHGEVWTGRGLTNTSGANGVTASNKTHVAICALIGEGPVPPMMIDGLRTAVNLTRDRWPGATAIMPHSSIKPTQCPGNALRTLVATDALEPEAQEPKVQFQYMQRGARGTRVARLQQAIGAGQDGSFGPKTEGKVRDMQAAIHPWGGPANGICGPELWNFVLWTEGMDQPAPALTFSPVFT